MARIFLAAALAATTALAGPALADSRPDLVVAVTKLTTHLDPMGANTNVNERISENLVENLIRYDFKTGELKPGLATKWERTSDTTMELTIREGVKCHNGEDFTAADVEYMFGPARFMGEKAPGNPIAFQFLPLLKSVTATGSHTVVFETTDPDFLLENRLAGWMGQVPCADAYKAAESWEAWGKAVVGTGPYKIDDFKPGELQRFVAFDDYWGEKAPAKSFTLKAVPELAARVAGLFTGEYGIITEIGPDQFATVNANPGTEVIGGPIRNNRVLVFDETQEPFDDVRVRRAAAMAIDRELIVETLFSGMTTVPLGLQDRSFGKMFIADFKPNGYNPAEAKRLLKEAGYDGKPLEYRYQNDYYTAEVKTAQVLQQMWADVGLNVEIKLMENWDQVYDKNNNGGPEIFNWSNTAYLMDPVGQLYRLYGENGPFQNRLATYVSPEMNAAADGGLFSTDLETRQAAMRKMLDVYENIDPPGTYIHKLPLFYGKQKSVNWTNTDVALMDFRAGNISFSAQ